MFPPSFCCSLQFIQSWIGATAEARYDFSGRERMERNMLYLRELSRMEKAALEKILQVFTRKLQLIFHGSQPLLDKCSK